ncbi:MAG TPA: alanine racemase [Thermoanaerobaculia bacterium]|jgi:alanine racemase|nr:alanine racemase [Thermoanaerobaculia bacterium]
MPSLPEFLETQRPTWVEIDLRAFERNVAAIASRLPAGTKLCAVLKADAYGHGAVELARRCKPEQVAMISVALLEEALELRREGIALPILVLGPLDERKVRIAIEHGITIGVPGPEELEAAAEVAKEMDVAIHLKLDSGMGRMGIVESELPRVMELIRSAPRLRVDALYTHFANADDVRDPFTQEQVARFETLVETLREAGLTASLHHVANSAATFRGITPGDFARVGIALYGVEAVPHERLEPVMRWRTAIARLKDLPAGHAIGYGTTFHTTRASRIATLPVGYADGYPRDLSNIGEVLVRGKRAPIVGRVSMDLVTIDVTDIDEPAIGDEVVLLGRQGDDEIAVEDLAAKLDTIPYEVVCGVSARVARVYRDGDTLTRIRTRFDA